MANHPNVSTTSDSGQEDGGTPGTEEKIRRLENDNGLLRGKIRGFVTLGDMFKESKQKNRMFEKQNALLVQILSLLISATPSDSDESAALPDELETILDLDTRPDEESLRLLTSITSKLRNKPLRGKLESVGEEQAETSKKIREEHARQTSETDLPPRYHLVSETETETPGTPSSASFSIIQQRSGGSQHEQYRDEFAEFKTKIAAPHLVASEKVKTVCDLFELVLRGGRVDDLSQSFGEVVRTVEQLERDARALNVVKDNACEELKRLRERPVAMGVIQGHPVDSSWVDVSHDANEVFNSSPPQASEKIRKESEHKDHVITKLRRHIDELTKANVAWDKKYESMKKEFSTKILKLKSAQKLNSRKMDAPEMAEFGLVGPEEVMADNEKTKIRDFEAKLQAKGKERETELHLLRQQVRIFKDDFATERNEHKKLWKKHQKVNENYQEVKRRVHDVSNRLAKAQKQLATEKREKELLQMSILKSQCGHQFHERPRLNLDPILPDHVSSNDVWKCPFCTFDNVSQRMVCEMCGKRGPPHHAPDPSYAELMSRERKDMTDVRPPPPLFNS